VLTNPGTPFTDEGFAAVVADLRRLFLLVSGGSNDLNNASQDVTQDGVANGENANNAFKLRGVNIGTTAPTDSQIITYSKATNSYVPRSISGVTAATGATALLSTNNLSDVNNTGTAKSNLGLGTGNSPTFNSLSLSGELIVTSGASVGADLTVTSGVTVGANLSVASGTVLSGGLRLSTTLMNSSSAVSTNASYILTSGVITITLPSAATHRVYFIGCDPGAAATVSALDGTQNIRGATGVTLVAGRIHTFMSDGGVSWLEGRSA
jgi:acetyltransferase-like isoleucine patch superfamily enzyme